MSPAASATRAASRWFERVVAVAIGSLATAWWLRGGGEADPGAIAAADPVATASQPEVAAGASPREPPRADTATTAPRVAAPREPPVEPPATQASSPRAPLAGDEADAGAAAVPGGPSEPAAVAPAGAAPSLPLPRMPGAMRLSDSSRFDAQAGAWVLKAAFRVHARSHHVLSFYRKALEDQGLSVTQTDDPPQADGAERTYLHGRSRRVHAQVGLRTRPGELETRVWILWRARA